MRLLNLGGKYFNSTSSIFVIAIFALFNSMGCNGHVSQKTKPNASIEIKDALKEAIEKIDTIEFNQYVAGKKNGLWRTFHKNGQLRTEGNYKNDLKEGLHKQWESNGILSLEGFYTKGKASGMMKWYHDKGHLAGSGNMQNDIRIGKWKICDVEDNGFCIDAYFKNGKRDGIWKIYHENARDKIWKEQTWKDDKIISEKCWDEKGKAIECD